MVLKNQVDHRELNRLICDGGYDTRGIFSNDQPWWI